MSDTKWRKLFTAVTTADLPIQQMVVKFIDLDEPRLMEFPPSLNAPPAYIDTIEFGPVELRSIEWLELPADLGPLLSTMGQFPIEVVDARTRVIGYLA